MMIRTVMMVVCCLWVMTTQAQTWKEWWQQQKTQIEYLVKQIAALQVYIDYAKKGYKIVDQGLTTIGHIKNGDFNLHRDFLGALKAVNPRIRNSAQVADIIALQVQLIQRQSKDLARARSSDQLTGRELDYLAGVYGRLVKESLDNLDELLELLTADAYVLSDDERLRRIAVLHGDMLEKHGFVQWFGERTGALITGRGKEGTDAVRSSTLLTDQK